jgi:putative DNA primase/helicase
VLSDFRDAILAAGLMPPEHIAPGKFYRFPGEGKKSSNRSGWCKLFEDGLGGVFGDFATGLQGTWRESRDDRDPGEWRRQAAAARASARQAREQDHQAAAGRARAIWRSANPADESHPYLARKHIAAYGTRVDRHGNLVVPVYARRRLVSLQLIAPDGAKRFLRGGQTKGGYFPIRGNHSTIVICEGFATGATIASATGHLVVVAFNAGNLLHVAESARRQYPHGDIVIAADMDRSTPGNPGLAKATLAARAVNARLAVPQFPPTVPGSDFNDLANWPRGPHG